MIYPNFLNKRLSFSNPSNWRYFKISSDDCMVMADLEFISQLTENVEKLLPNLTKTDYIVLCEVKRFLIWISASLYIKLENEDIYIYICWSFILWLSVFNTYGSIRKNMRAYLCVLFQWCYWLSQYKFSYVSVSVILQY